MIIWCIYFTISGTIRVLDTKKLCWFVRSFIFDTSGYKMTVEIGSMPPPTMFITSLEVFMEMLEGVRQRVNQDANQTPTNPTSTIATTSQTNLVTSFHPNTHVVDEAFTMAIFS